MKNVARGDIKMMTKQTSNEMTYVYSFEAISLSWSCELYEYDSSYR